MLLPFASSLSLSLSLSLYPQQEVFSFPDVAICLGLYQGCLTANIPDCLENSFFSMVDQWVSAKSTRVLTDIEEKKEFSPGDVGTFLTPPGSKPLCFNASFVHVSHFPRPGVCVAFYAQSPEIAPGEVQHRQRSKSWQLLCTFGVLKSTDLRL